MSGSSFVTSRSAYDASALGKLEDETERWFRQKFQELRLRQSEAVAAENPALLYRFRRSTSSFFEEEMRYLIEKDQMFFPRQTELDDPFDCLPVSKKAPGYRTYCRKLWPIQKKFLDAVAWETLAAEDAPRAAVDQAFAYLEAPSKIRRFLYDEPDSDQWMDHQFRQVGVLSLTKSMQNLVLWSTYANNSLGVCIELDGAKAARAFGTPLPITYTNVRPHFDHYGHIALQMLNRPHRIMHLSGEEIDIAFSGMAQFNSLYTKSERWAYQEEYRVVWFEGGGRYISIDPMSVSRIIFGHEVTQDKLGFVRALCKQTNSKIGLAVARPHPTEFSMTICDLDLAER